MSFLTNPKHQNKHKPIFYFLMIAVLAVAGYLVNEIISKSNQAYNASAQLVERDKNKREAVNKLRQVSHERANLISRLLIEENTSKEEHLLESLYQRAEQNALNMLSLAQSILDGSATDADKTMLHGVLPEQALIDAEFDKLLSVMEDASSADLAALKDLSQHNTRAVYILFGFLSVVSIVAVLLIHTKDKNRTAELEFVIEEQSAEITAQCNALGQKNEELEQKNEELELTATIIEEQSAEIAAQYKVLAQKNEELERIALTDVLTGLESRHCFNNNLEAALARAQRNPKQGFSLMYLDLDKFKAVNDTLGHAAGDEVLKQVALRMDNCLRQVDHKGRRGGDEFIVLLHDTIDEAAVKATAQKLIDTISKKILFEGERIQVGVSIGITICKDGDGVSAENLIKEADAAVYEAKNAGRNTFRIHH